MAITKALYFAEGVSVTAPTEVSQLGVFASDANYVSAKGASASDGDIYYNSTLDLIRYYNGAWKSIADESSLQNLSNKGIIDVSRLDVKKDTRTNLDTYATTATNGQLCFATDEKVYYGIKDGVVETIGGGGIDAWVTSFGYAVGDIVYYNDKIYRCATLHTSGTFITDFTSGYWVEISAERRKQNYLFLDFENNASGWAGSTGLTIARNTTTPMFGIADGKISKDAVNRAGATLEYPVTIDSGAQASILTLRFESKTSTNYVDGDVYVYLYDVTNAVVISPSDPRLFASSLSSTKTYQFQTNSNSTSYKIRFYVNSTNANAYDIYIDDLEFGKKDLINGAVDVYLGALTTTGSWTTNTSYTGKYWRKGNILRYDIFISLSVGAPTATTLSVNLPFTINSTLVGSSGAGLTHNGYGVINDASGSNYPAIVTYKDTTSIYVGYSDDAATGVVRALVSNTAPVTFTGGDTISIVGEVPIVGWDTNATMSETFSGRSFNLYAKKTSTQTITAGAGQTIITGWTKLNDSTAIFDATTGVLTLQESGPIDLSGSILIRYGATASTDGGLFLVSSINSTIDYCQCTKLTANAYESLKVSVQGYYGTKGETLTLKCSATTQDYVVQNSGNSFSFSSGSSSQQIYASEKQIAIYRDSSGQAITSGNVITWNSKVLDTHNALSAGVFRCEKSGVLKVFGAYKTQNVAMTTDQYVSAELVVNGTAVEFDYWRQTGTGSSTQWPAKFQYSWPVNMGDLCSLKFVENIGAVNMSTDLKDNYVMFEVV